MTHHRTLFVTNRAPRHQKTAIEAAPASLEIVMCPSPTRDEVLTLLPTVEFFISERTGVIDAEMIAASRNLRLIQRLGSQTHDIDIPAARASGIPVCYYPIQTCIMVAEHTLTLMFALLKRLPEVTTVAREAKDWGVESKKCDENTFAYNWSGRRDIRTLNGATVGIVGYGEIGAELALRLRHFGCTVLYNKRSRLPAETEEFFGLEYATIDRLQAESDIIVSLLPTTPQTDQMINRDFVARMKDGAILVSTGASTALNEADVAAALREGKLGGLATDGYTWEPIRPDNPLLPLAQDPCTNIILTPHVAAGDLSAHKDARVKDYANIVALLEGRPLKFRLA